MNFIIAELLIWAAMIALLPVACAVGVALLKHQARREVEERLRTPKPAGQSPEQPAMPLRGETASASPRRRA